MNRFIKGLLYGSPVIISVTYLILGVFWIQYSDMLVLNMVEDPVVVTSLQTYKGWGFVIVTALLLYGLIQKNNNLLGKEIKEKTAAEKNLSDSLAEKEVLLAEVHHRVKNNLALVSGLVEMQSTVCADKQARLALEESRIRIKSMAMIYDYIYATEEGVEVAFGSYLKELEKYLFQLFDCEKKGVVIRKKISDVTLNINHAISVALICNELLMHICRHELGDDPDLVIDIKLHQQGKSVSIVVTDNGSGILSGMSFESPETIGFKIIQLQLKQIRAEWELERTGGTRFEFFFDNVSVKGPRDSMSLPGKGDATQDILTSPTVS